MPNKPRKAATTAELRASSLSSWDNEGGAGPKQSISGWLIAVVYLGGENDARGIAERWAASFDDPEAARTAVMKKSGSSNSKVVRQLDAAELASAGVRRAGSVARFEAKS